MSVPADGGKAGEAWAVSDSHVAVDAIRAIRAAVSTNHWDAAFELRDQTRSVWQRDPETRVHVSGLLLDAPAVLRDEAAVVGQRGLDDIAQLPADLALLCVSARSHLDLVPQALEVLIAHQGHAGHSANTRRTEAQLRARLDDLSGALSIWRELWDGGDDGVLVSLIGCLVQSGDGSACIALLEEAQAAGRGAGDGGLTVAWCHYWGGMKEPARSVNALERAGAGLPANVSARLMARFAADCGRKDLLEDVLRQAEGWLLDSAGRCAYAPVAQAVLSHHWRCVSDGRRIEAALSELETMRVNPGTCAALARIRFGQGRHAKAVQQLRRGLADFPGAPVLWTPLLSALGTMGDAAGCAAARAAFQEELPKPAGLLALAKADPNAWHASEIADLVEAAVNSGQPRLLDAFLKKLRRVRLPLDLLDTIFAESGARCSPSVRASVEIMRLNAHDMRTLETSVVAPVPMSVFKNKRPEIVSEMGAVLNRCACGMDGHGASQKREWLSRCLEALRQIEARHGTTCHYSAESFADASRVASELIRRIRSGVATSAVRIGDGEGHFLNSDADDPESAAADREFIQQKWWGKRRPSHRDAVLIEEGFRRALRRADVLGIVPQWRLVRTLNGAGNLATGRGIVKGLSWVANADVDASVIASAHFHEDLQSWGLWPEVFAVAPRVSWISCHDLTGYLLEDQGVCSRQEIVIPPEKRWEGVFRARTGGAMDDDDTLIERHHEVCKEIAPIQGEVYLVAAGFLGKIYCDVVRSRGGIGIDIGSLADCWMGYSTREFHRDSAIPLSIGSAFIEGNECPATASAIRILGESGSVCSTRSGRYNIGHLRKSESNEARVRTLLRVVGHPRCASGYMATLLAVMGLRVGHEKLLADGIASWSHVVADRCVPYGDNASWSVDFDRTIVHVRDPFDSVPSIILENGESVSFDFRRQHILRATGVDLASYTTPIDRAVASLIFWHEVAMRLIPDAVFRVEDPGSIRKWVAEWKDAEDSGHVAEGERDGIVGYNSTAKATRFAQSKPTLTRADWLGVDAALFERLAAFCREYTYALPWERHVPGPGGVHGAGARLG